MCVDGYYLVGKVCHPCKPGCKECSEDDIELCPSCLPGYFEDGTTCTKCESPCETCIFSSKNCLTCGYGPALRMPAPSCACKD